ncbi:hypothetical protein NP493_229g03068 [Ridgeia piscesae]|uniref:Uncharacterized protein n=1 Tax=Ridgeia piscesae TaxID=27915 RepID=A0AAD9P044_RIDPI|nr:hypothetical protein NP493_229g03068 [Ridgeia piscesae]
MKAQVQRRSAMSWSVIERQLDRTCGQLQVLHRRMEELRVRHRRVAKQPRGGHCVEMELRVVEGIYSAYYEYGAMKAGQLMQLHQRVDQRVTAEDDCLYGRE